MPYPADMVASFKRRYGRDWKQKFFAYKNAHPARFGKAVKTARQRGHGGIIASLARKR